MPLLRTFGSVATFNIVYLLMVILAGYALFRAGLVCHRTAVESWLAGALFSWSPWMVTRGIGHFSLVAAAPLPIFILLLLRCRDRPRMRDGLALGATICWAATTDPYYAVYCVMIAIVFLVGVTVRSHHEVRATEPRTLDLLIACVGGFTVSLLIGHGWQLNILGVHVTSHQLYTPMLLLTLLGMVRVAWPYRHFVVSVDGPQALHLIRVASVAAMVGAIMLSPVLYAVGVRIRDTGFEATSVLWRSSPAGLDLLTFLLPNPNHPLAPDWLRAWLTPRPDRYLENVASLTFTAIIAIVAALRTGWRPSAFWIALTVTSGCCHSGRSSISPV